MRQLKWLAMIAAAVGSTMPLWVGGPAKADAIVNLSGADSNHGAPDLTPLGSRSLGGALRPSQMATAPRLT
jgi:hypothetical protein